MKRLLILATTLLAIYFSKVDCAPSGLFITADNIRHYASYIDPDVTIGPRVISIASGSNGETLIDVPIMSAGEFNRYTSVRITVSLDPGVGVDHDPYFGLTDGITVNEFYLRDGNHQPCHPHSASSNSPPYSSSTGDSHTPGEFTFIFTPFHRFGVCSTPKLGGYTVLATFTAQLDMNRDIKFRLRRDTSSETYSIYYFLIETFE